MYEFGGFGLIKDTAKARAWYERAAAGAIDDAKAGLERLSGEKQ
jgi:TPR repeat protein